MGLGMYSLAVLGHGAQHSFKMFQLQGLDCSLI